MSTIYVPRLIESAEQAEALPIGTVAIREDHYAREKVGPTSWIAPWGTDHRRDAMVGWTALLPVEVSALEDYHRDLDADRMTYRTPWRTR